MASIMSLIGRRWMHVRPLTEITKVEERFWGSVCGRSDGNRHAAGRIFCVLCTLREDGGRWSEEGKRSSGVIMAARRWFVYPFEETSRMPCPCRWSGDSGCLALLDSSKLEWRAERPCRVGFPQVPYLVGRSGMKCLYPRRRCKLASDMLCERR